MEPSPYLPTDLTPIIFCRVALTPVVVATLVKKGFTVNVEEGAGLGAKFRDADYKGAGANIVKKEDAFSNGTRSF